MNEIVRGGNTFPLRENAISCGPGSMWNEYGRNPNPGDTRKRAVSSREASMQDISIIGPKIKLVSSETEGRGTGLGGYIYLAMEEVCKR